MSPLRVLTATASALGVGLALLSAVAQTPTNGPAAPATNAPARRPGPAPVRSPQVLDDGRVTFRLMAPKATQVLLNGQWPEGRVALEKGTNGLWSVTTGPVPAGVWEYSFAVDGVNFLDPVNPALKPMREPRTSILHLPGQSPLLHDFQDVPHGTVHQHTYRSKALGKLREMAVYTPPGYEAETAKAYPVLYLQHGSGDNQATWVAHGKAHWILDNLLAQGRVKPMVVVMLDGHAVAPGDSGSFTNNTVMFERDLLGEVLPWVETTYRVRKDAAGRGIVGLSMGGGQSLQIGLNHVSQFAWIGGFSAATPGRDAVENPLAHAESVNQQVKLLWIACGKQDFLLNRNLAFIEVLKQSGIRHQWLLTEGDHSWPVWRKYLADFAPLVFQDAK
jgi:enterochelin esterase-like enzyme